MPEFLHSDLEVRKYVKDKLRLAAVAKIVILNHFLSTNRFFAQLEKWANPICQKIGWRSDLALADLVAKTQIEIDYRYKLRSVDLWETVVTTNTKSALALA